MTDKQIIIDVTQCPYYKEDKTCTYLPYKSKCEGDCNWTAYKEMGEQLKAKEQECEELKKQHQANKGLITSTGKQNYQLLQEYDKLKTENDNIKETFDGLFKVQYKLADNNKKLRQCITEIKEIVEKGVKIHDDIIVSKQILQKISECEVEQ